MGGCPGVLYLFDVTAAIGFTSLPIIPDKVLVVAIAMTTSAPPGSAVAGGSDLAPAAAATQQKIPRISVVLPAYNAQRFILTSVNSVLSQTFSDFECIVIDDGSTDRTGSMIQRLAGRDPRVKQLAVPHGGIVSPLNARRTP